MSYYEWTHFLWIFWSISTKIFLWRIEEILNSWRQEWHKAVCWDRGFVAIKKWLIFLIIKVSYFCNKNDIFCLKSQKGECFLPNEPYFLQVWWKLRNLTCCSKYSRSNKHPVVGADVALMFNPLFSGQKVIKQNFGPCPPLRNSIT